MEGVTCSFFRVLPFSLAFSQSRCRCGLCACVSLCLSLSLQLLVVLFIVYWECGCVFKYDLELVMEYPGSSVVIHRHEGKEDFIWLQRSLHSTDLLLNPPLWSHVSIPQDFNFLTGSPRLILGRIYLFDQMLNFPFYGGGSWLDGKLINNFSHESDVTSLQDPFMSCPYKTPFYFYYCVPCKIRRGILPKTMCTRIFLSRPSWRPALQFSQRVISSGFPY